MIYKSPIIYTSHIILIGRSRTLPIDILTTPWISQRLKVATGTEENVDVVNHMVSGEDVNSDSIGNVDMWPGHEGLHPKASNAPLTTPLYLIKTVEGKLKDSIDFTNRCRLHQCSAYCLTKKIKSSKGTPFHLSF